MDPIAVVPIVFSLLVVILGTIAFLWGVIRAGDPDDPEYVKCQILCFVFVPFFLMAWMILYAFPEVGDYVRSTIHRQRLEKRRRDYKRGRDP